MPSLAQGFILQRLPVAGTDGYLAGMRAFAVHGTGHLAFAGLIQPGASQIKSQRGTDAGATSSTSPADLSAGGIESEVSPVC